MTGDHTIEQVTCRWMRAQRALKAGDQIYARYLSSMIRACPSIRSAGIRDPLEAILFALLIDVEKELDTGGDMSLQAGRPRRKKGRGEG